MITREQVQDWLDRYVEAWRTYDAAAIGDLFSDDVEYRYFPYDEPVRGRGAVVDTWLRPGGDPTMRDAPGTYEARYEPWAVDGDRAVAIGRSRYWSDASRTEPTETFDNCYLLRFDEDGRCSAFTEYYVKAPKA
jgi:ketosteroid isomerase-like protein